MVDMIEQLNSICGAEYVTPAGEFRADRQDTSPFEREPLAYVSPADVDELKRIVTYAAENKIEVWTSSQGRNWGYSATVPRSHKAIVVLLRRMNRVVHIDKDLAYAVIEPGVTYGQLHDYVAEHAPGLWIDCIDGTPNGSVMGNALERGVGPTPYGDHYGHLCGMEVLLPNGEIIQTGGLRDAATLHTYRWGAGPIVDGLFSQSNFGIVLRVGIWLMPKPACFRSFLFESYDHVEFGEIIDAFRKLLLDGTVRGAVRMINDMVSLSLIAQYPNGPNNCMSAEQIEKLRLEFGIARWTMSAGLYGSLAAVRAQQRELKKGLGKLGRIEFLSDFKVGAIENFVQFTKKRQPGSLLRNALEWIPKTIANKSLDVVEAVPYVHGLLQGRPTEFFVRHAYFKMPVRPAQDINPARDGCGVIWFAPIVRNNADDIERVLKIGRETYDEYEFEYHIALIFQNPRSAIVLMSIFYYRDDPQERERAAKLEDALAKRCREANFIEYRTAVSHMPGLYGDPAYQNLLTSLKNAVDPDNILAPARYNTEPGAVDSK